MTPQPAHRRARRALLFCPGTERRKIDKAAGLSVDSVIIDLEDAAALSKKDEARETTFGAVDELDFGATEVLVRINPVGSGLDTEDLEALAQASCLPDGLVLPKVSSAADVEAVAAALDRIEAAAGLGEPAMVIIAIIETAMGVVRLSEIAASSPRLQALIFGAEDLSGDMGARRSSQGWEVFYAQSAVVLHAAAFGLQSIDTPFVNLNDPEGLQAETQRALDLGFTGKLAIHPKQIAPIADVFTPTPEEIAAAKRLIREHDKHQADGRGVFELDGKMVDMPMVRAAYRVLSRRPETPDST